MSKYIDAEKLIAEIERLHKAHSGKYGCDEVGLNLEYLEDFITSNQQEQPEIDLEEYIENEIKHYGLSLYEASYGTFSASEIERIMRKFYELGLKARKV